MKKNLLDEVSIAPKAAEEYLDFANDIANNFLLKQGCDPKSIPDENARVLANGDLEIYLLFQGQKYSFVVRKNDWVWNTKNNNSWS